MYVLLFYSFFQHSLHYKSLHRAISPSKLCKWYHALFSCILNTWVIVYLLAWGKNEKREHSKEDLGNGLKKMKHVNNINTKELCGPFDLFEWVFCALLSEISWHIYRPCQREKERMKVVGGGRQLTGPYCKKYHPVPVWLLFLVSLHRNISQKKTISPCASSWLLIPHIRFT